MNKSNHNNSPWLSQLKSDRPFNVISNSEYADICIVGGGIAGMMTAFFTLKYTNKTICLLEGHRIAHGATGHNAGQIASYFERPFSSIVDEFGLDMAGEAQKNILIAWNLIDEIYNDLSIQTPKVEFIGYAGFTNINDINNHLHNNYLRIKCGITQPLPTLISNTVDTKMIHSEFLPLVEFVENSELKKKLEIDDDNYIAVFRSKKGLLNSAALTVEIAEKLQQQYGDRFKIFEHSKVEKIVLNLDNAEATCWGFKIHCSKIVLCTNGFEGVKIINQHNINMDHKLSHNIKRVVGYMAGYIDTNNSDPIAISYFPQDMKNSLINESTYFYLTRRHFTFNDNNNNNMLVCLGGPEQSLDISNIYVRDHPYDQQFKDELDNFIDNLNSINNNPSTSTFNWFGLMGYTKSGLRIIGNDTTEKALMYNIGCNGVGILSAIYGGYKIAKLLSGQIFSPSIFDPQK